MSYILFRLSATETLSQRLLALTHVDLEVLFGQTILARGQNYYYSDRVSGVTILPGNISATIIGSDYYNTYIRQTNNAVESDCDCPYDGGFCKHQAALLLHLSEAVSPEELTMADMTATPSGDTSSKDVFEDFLAEQSVEALRQLVRNFAPADFRAAVRLKKESPKQQSQVIKKIVQKVDGLMDEELYDSDLFEKALLEMVQPLRGIWQEFPDQITELMLSVIEGVDDAFDEGYLYDDYNDNIYEGYEFGIYMAEFVAALSGETQAEALDKIKGALDVQSYSTHDNFMAEFIGFAKAEDLYNLKDALLHLQDKEEQLLYEKLQSLMKGEEQELFLKSRAENNAYFTLKLVSFYEQNQAIPKAIQVAEQQLSAIIEKQNEQHFYHSIFNKEREAELFEKRLELEHRYQKDEYLIPWAKKYVRVFPSVQAMNYVLKLAPEQRSYFEELMEQKNVHNYAAFLEEEKRLQEVLQLFANYPEQFKVLQKQYNFFRKYKQNFPGSAKEVFEKVLDEHLPHAKSQSYYAVAEVLQHLKAVEDSKAFSARIAAIKARYARRRSLLSILAQAGL